ncbi:hypothetical protein B0H13DRAFT_1615945, partial [Mycena leptocephala]
LRPLCFVGERLYKWRPVVSRSDRHALSAIPESDLIRTTNVLSHAWADGTLETYGSGLLFFHYFCDARIIPESQRAPASSDLIATFAASAAGTVENYVAGVRAWHILHGISWAPNKAELDALIRGAIALQPPSSSRKKQLPYTEEIIAAILSQLNPDIPLDAATGSCLTTSFYSAARCEPSLCDRSGTARTKRKRADHQKRQSTSLYLQDTIPIPHVYHNITHRTENRFHTHTEFLTQTQPPD